MPSAPVALGPFVLLAPAARGGMAEVWRAVHPASGAPVAVKVLAGDGSDRPVLVRALATEVRAAAALRHPNVVRVLDAGQVGPEAALASAGRLRVGAPWLAMDWVPTSAEASPPVGWAGVRRILLATLAALAHAHARGVVHRDVKPANVLLGPRGLPRLADFGLALSVDDPEVGRVRGGTPGYAAPEQLAGAAWECGPWTDLFGTGALAWALVCGRAPSDQVADPTMSTPGDFPAWVERMMARDWRDRFASAADARRALARLGAADVAPDAFTSVPVGSSAATVLFDDPSPASVGPAFAVGWARSPGRMQRRPPADAPAGPGLRDIGLGLLGLSEPPIVGRSAEQAALWSALARVRRRRRTEAVVLVGPGGAGTTRLARWLVRAADELGLGLPLVSERDPGPEGRVRELAGAALGSLDPVASAVARLPEALAEGVAELFGQGPVRRTGSGVERRALVREVAAALAGPRVVALALDDATDPEATALASEWMDQRDAVPALIVLTTAAVTGPLAALLLRPRTTRVDVGELGADDARTLVAAVLPLSAESARALAVSTRGSPGRIVEALRHWALLGQLAPGADGFAPTVALPADATGFARARVDAVLGGLPATDRRALEASAALGPRIDDAEWRAVCGLLGALPGPALLPAVLRAGIGRPEPSRGPGRWRIGPAFAGALLPSGGDPALHEACAAMLGTRGDEGLVRRATHLERAGSPDALYAWIKAIDHVYDRDSEGASHLADHAATLFRPDTPAATRLQLVRLQAQLAYLLGRYDVLDGLAREAVSLARTVGPVFEAQALFLRALGCESRGEFQAARAMFLEVATLMEEVGEPRSAAVALGNAAMSASASPEQALGWLERALALAPADNEDQRAVRTWLALDLAMVLVAAGRPREALARLAALEAEALGSTPLNVGHWRHVRGLASIEAGEPEAALADALAALEQRTRMGLPAPSARILAARAMVALDRPKEALAVLAVECPDPGEVLAVRCQRVRVLARLGRTRELRAEIAAIELGEPHRRAVIGTELARAAQDLRTSGHPRLADRLDRARVPPAP